MALVGQELAEGREGKLSLDSELAGEIAAQADFLHFSCKDGTLISSVDALNFCREDFAAENGLDYKDIIKEVRGPSIGGLKLQAQPSFLPSPFFFTKPPSVSRMSDRHLISAVSAPSHRERGTSSISSTLSLLKIVSLDHCRGFVDLSSVFSRFP